MEFIQSVMRRFHTPVNLRVQWISSASRIPPRQIVRLLGRWVPWLLSWFLNFLLSYCLAALLAYLLKKLEIVSKWIQNWTRRILKLNQISAKLRGENNWAPKMIRERFQERFNVIFVNVPRPCLTILGCPGDPKIRQKSIRGATKYPRWRFQSDLHSIRLILFWLDLVSNFNEESIIFHHVFLEFLSCFSTGTPSWNIVFYVSGEPFSFLFFLDFSPRKY